MKKTSGMFWGYGCAFILSLIGFVAADFNHDVQHLVWYGFCGALWFRLAEREAAK